MYPGNLRYRVSFTISGADIRLLGKAVICASARSLEFGQTHVGSIMQIAKGLLVSPFPLIGMEGKTWSINQYCY